MKKIGIYGGTFDPIHHGHLILAREACETFQLEKIIFVPAAISPHKIGRTPAPAEFRLEMLRSAIDGESGFALDDCELRRDLPSYTIETVEFIRKSETDAQIFYFVGEDNMGSLSIWHRFDELQKMVRFAVLDRTGFASEPLYPVIRRYIDISATEIRKRVATGRSIRYLVPPAVEEIIHRHQLYQEPQK